jgi:hypothetical protein
MTETEAEWVVPDVYTLVYTNSGDFFEVVDSLDRIDAKTSEWLNSGGNRDSWVSLTGIDGNEVRVLAGDIRRLTLSTPAGRARGVLIEKRRETEYVAARVEAGYLPGDD